MVLSIEIFRWDAFNQTEDAAGSASEKHTDLIKKASYCLKITTAFFVSLVVLIATCVSKGALFFMIAQVPLLNETTNPSLEYCSNTNETFYHVKYGEKQSIAWMW